MVTLIGLLHLARVLLPWVCGCLLYIFVCFYLILVASRKGLCLAIALSLIMPNLLSIISGQPHTKEEEEDDDSEEEL